MSEKYVNANGVQLAYDEFGNQSDPAMILIMGLGTQMIAWPEELCEQLADKGFRVVRFDNRDIGLSEKMHNADKPNLLWVLLRARLGVPFKVPYTLKDMADDTVGLMDALDIDKAHLVGCSMGGMIGQLVSAHAGHRVLSFTSIMSTSGSRKLPSPRPEIMRAMTRGAANSEEELVEQRVGVFRLIGSKGELAPKDDEIREKVRRSYRRNYHPAGYVRHMAAIAHSGSRVHLLKKIDRPTLVIHGKEDPLAPVEAGIDTARHIPNAELELIDNMGHDLPRVLIPRLVELISRHAKRHQR
ncbi:MAG: alpha/beta fold hydrolase [Arenicella sp.]|nr:alpha/beta fold hydrolase [Arenicella sp.]